MSARSRLLLDIAMFAALIAAFNPAWTGMAVHEWLSIAVMIPLLFHVIINWDQTVHVINTFARRLAHSSRLNIAVDIALFVSAVAVMLSGMLVSQTISAALGLALAPGAIWIAVHSVAADLTIALLAVHFALHWRWVVSTVGRLLGAPAPTSAPARPAPIRIREER